MDIVQCSKHDLGQYFTTNNKLQEKVLEFILNDTSNILEPSIGRGDLIKAIKNKKSNVIFDMYEIDTKIKLLDEIEKEKVIYGDFMNQEITKTYKLDDTELVVFAKGYRTEIHGFCLNGDQIEYGIEGAYYGLDELPKHKVISS